MLNFAHDFLRAAVEQTFVSDQAKQDESRVALADFFEAQPISTRSCDELPWLLSQTNARDRLRACLLGIDRFLGLSSVQTLDSKLIACLVHVLQNARRCGAQVNIEPSQAVLTWAAVYGLASILGTTVSRSAVLSNGSAEAPRAIAESRGPSNPLTPPTRPSLGAVAPGLRPRALTRTALVWKQGGS